MKANFFMNKVNDECSYLNVYIIGCMSRNISLVYIVAFAFLDRKIPMLNAECRFSATLSMTMNNNKVYHGLGKLENK